jgi:hypothetical protein
MALKERRFNDITMIPAKSWECTSQNASNSGTFTGLAA